MSYVKGDSGPWDFLQDEHGSFDDTEIVAIDALMKAFCYVDRGGYTFEHRAPEGGLNPGYYISKWHQSGPIGPYENFADFIAAIEMDLIHIGTWRSEYTDDKSPTILTLCRWCDHVIKDGPSRRLVMHLQHCEIEHATELGEHREERRAEVQHLRDYYVRRGDIARVMEGRRR